MSYDFSGWATRNNIRCSDGRTIMRDAFKAQDGQVVPLVWNHRHNEPENVLGHAKLENRENGVYAYCTFNDTESGKNAKLLVEHGDVNALSIYANQLKQQGGNVLHGAIREVSLVLAGANPGAFIDSVISHGEESDEEAVIYSGDILELSHADDEKTNKKEEESAMANETEQEKNKPAEGEETIEDVFNTLSEKQKTVVYALIGKAMENKEGDANMKHNVFEDDETMSNDTLSHAEQMDIISDAKRYGTMSESALAHGITNVEYLFPDAQTLNNPPDFIQRDMGWVKKVMNGTHHTPFSRIKSMFANITEDEARAKGYIKGGLKKDEVFSLLKRTTDPTTIYKKQKMERDDVIDITSFDVIAWLKSEMRMMLDEEIARAVLISDGRAGGSDDKINETHIRPISKDEDLYTIKKQVDEGSNDDDKANNFIATVIKSRKEYKGSGEPTLFTTEDMLTDMLLLKDAMGRDLYDDVDKLAKKLRVKEIVTVPVMEGAKGAKGGVLLGIIVNLVDYNIGADKGGAVNMFDDFDIDYNAQKYLIETRCSGALIKPYSAIAFETTKPAPTSEG